MKNPFSLSFGKKPLNYISRIAQTHTLVETFQDDNPSTQLYMITGVRGSGKTVFMTAAAKELQKDDRWIVIELNPERDMLMSLASKLYSIPEVHSIIVKAKLDFSFFGLGVSIECANPVSDIETVISRMLEEINKSGKRILILVDEVTVNPSIKIFASTFQIFIRQNLPIFLLMTGLYENIYDLQNEKSLTFLYRAIKIQLEPLNHTAVKKSYMDIFRIPSEKAGEMALCTKGYPFAYQVLGYLLWENKETKELNDILPEYDQYLEEYVYEKIWTELSELDRKVIYEIAVSESGKIINIRENLEMSSSLFSVYRDRLKRKGVIDTKQRGYIQLSLPRFKEYVLEHY